MNPIKTKIFLCALSMFLVTALLTSCAAKPVEWNGKTVYTHVTMGIDETNLFGYVGAVDYVFVGKVTEAAYAVTEENDQNTIVKGWL